MGQVKSEQNIDNGSTLAFLQQKSPAELLDELEDMIGDTPEEALDIGLVDDYLAVLDEKAPLRESIDAEEAYQRFTQRYAGQLDSLSLEQQRPVRHRQANRPKLKFAYAVAIFCLFLFAGTAIAQASGFPIFARFIDWGAEVLQLSRNETLPSGSLTLPADSDQEYHSTEEALRAYGLPTHNCPTWIPERFHLELVDVQSTPDLETFFALYLDDAGQVLSFSVKHDQNTATTVFSTEIDEGSGETYVLRETEYFLGTNMGESVASWLDESCFYSISGEITREELKQILASILQK